MPIAQSASLPPTRHEIDELFSTTVAAAIDAGVLALCGPYPGEALPLEIYGNLVADVRANGTPVVVDLSPPRLDSALEGGPDLVKINDWELAKYIAGPVDTEEQDARRGAERLLEAGRGSGDHHPRRGAGDGPARGRAPGNWSRRASSAAPARAAATR